MKYKLKENANTEHESAEEMYDSYGSHVSTENHGDICLQAFDFDSLDESDDDALIAKQMEDYTPEDADDRENLESCLASLLERARSVAGDMGTIESLLDDAVTCYECGDLDGCLEALESASREEREHGDNPATRSLREALIEESEDDEDSAAA